MPPLLQQVLLELLSLEMFDLAVGSQTCHLAVHYCLDKASVEFKNEIAVQGKGQPVSIVEIDLNRRFPWRRALRGH